MLRSRERESEVGIEDAPRMASNYTLEILHLWCFDRRQRLFCLNRIGRLYLLFWFMFYELEIIGQIHHAYTSPSRGDAQHHSFSPG